jgi:hypothetical protein
MVYRTDKGLKRKLDAFAQEEVELEQMAQDLEALEASRKAKAAGQI